MGQVVSPDDAALALRGLRTMAVRLERSTCTALQVAEWLATRPEVSAVLCPMLPGAPGHELWQRDYAGGCGLFSFVLAEGCDKAARARLLDALSLFGVRRSAFTVEDVRQTGLALAVFGAGLPAFVWHKIFSPAYFAREDTKTPMRYALIAIAVNAGMRALMSAYPAPQTTPSLENSTS